MLASNYGETMKDLSSTLRPVLLSACLFRYLDLPYVIILVGFSKICSSVNVTELFKCNYMFMLLRCLRQVSF